MELQVGILLFQGKNGFSGPKIYPEGAAGIEICNPAMMKPQNLFFQHGF